MPGSLPDTNVELTEEDLREVADMLFVMTGIRLNSNKRELVRSRLRRRLSETGFETISSYLTSVREHGGEELRRMVEALTTNETRFFREPSHFQWLGEQVLSRASAPINIWSAACSTGEEPYSIAMCALEHAERTSSAPQVRILATDIDRQVLDQGRAGVYREDTLANVPVELIDRYFEPLNMAEPRGATYRITEVVRNKVSFARLNLMSDWPMSGPFEAIFLRNVMIYFDRPTRDWLAQRMARLLGPGGYLVIGHSENLGRTTPGLRNVGSSVYQRTDESLPPLPARPR